MKTNLTPLIVFFLATTLLTSCNIDILNRVTGNGDVVTKSRKVNSTFTNIKVSNGIDLYITQGTKHEISVEADENLHELIITEINKGQLKIYTEKNIWRASALKVHVLVKNLEELIASSGSDVRSENTFKVNELTLKTSSGADIRMTVEGKNIQTNSSSGSTLRIAGTTENHSAKASSGSMIKAYGLKSNHIIAKASSGADIDVFASKSIEAKASSGGDIDYAGKPEKVTVKSSSGGRISAQ